MKRRGDGREKDGVVWVHFPHHAFDAGGNPASVGNTDECNWGMWPVPANVLADQSIYWFSRLVEGAVSSFVNNRAMYRVFTPKCLAMLLHVGWSPIEAVQQDHEAPSIWVGNTDSLRHDQRLGRDAGHSDGCDGLDVVHV